MVAFTFNENFNTGPVPASAAVAFHDIRRAVFKSALQREFNAPRWHWVPAGLKT